MKSKLLKKPGEKLPKGFVPPELYTNIQEDEDDFSSTGTVSSHEEEEEPIVPIVIPRPKVAPIIHILQEETDFR